MVSSLRQSKEDATGARGNVGVACNRVAELFDPMNVAAALLAGAIVYLVYHPSDSVAVEQGDALWFALLAIVTATVTWSGWFWQCAGRSLLGLGRREEVEEGVQTSGKIGLD